MARASRFVRVSVRRAFPLLAVLAASCSGSSSRLILAVESIVGASPGSLNNSYISGDLIGNADSACGALAADTATVTVSVQHPGTIGPFYGGHLTGYEIAYFYYDPADGILKGPVAPLGVANSNISVSLPSSGEVFFTIPVVTFRVKAWSAGVDCHNITGFAGALRVTRMIAQITVRGVDDTGKSLSASGNISISLENFAPGPAPTDSCAGMTIKQYLSGLCSFEE